MLTRKTAEPSRTVARCLRISRNTMRPIPTSTDIAYGYIGIVGMSRARRKSIRHPYRVEKCGGECALPRMPRSQIARHASLAFALDNGPEAVGLDGFGEDLRIADSLCLDDKGMGAGVARQKDDPSRVPLVAKPRVGVDA